MIHREVSNIRDAGCKDEWNELGGMVGHDFTYRISEPST